MTDKIKDLLPLVKFFLITLAYGIILMLINYNYRESLKIEYLLISRILNLFITNISAFFYLVGFILYCIIYVKLSNHLKNNKCLHIGVIISILILVLVITNLLVDEIYVVDGDKKNRFEVIGLIAKDCIDKDTETIIVDDFDIDRLSFYYSGGKFGSGNNHVTKYININDEHISLIDNSCSDALWNKSQVVGKTKLTIYKNSKIVVAVDDVPLRQYRYNYIKAEPRFDISMYKDGHIDIEQSIIIKPLGDISDSCSVCFVKDGQICAGFSVEHVQKNIRGAEWVPDGIYEVYVLRLGKPCSNIIKYERQGDNFNVLE